MEITIYNTATMEAVEIVSGDDQAEMETYLHNSYDFNDEYAVTGSPAFGTVDGCFMTADTKRTDLYDGGRVAR